MGPRLVSRGKQPGAASLVLDNRLQWGRDLLVAESVVFVLVVVDVGLLQWGRDLLVAERLFLMEIERWP